MQGQSCTAYLHWFKLGIRFCVSPCKRPCRYGGALFLELLYIYCILCETNKCDMDITKQIKEQLIEKLNQHMQQHDMSIGALARELSIAQPNLSKYLRTGGEGISINKLESCLVALGYRAMVTLNINRI